MHWYENISLWSFLAGWVAAQTIKFFVGLAKYKRLDFTYYFSTGGMPSAHTACVSALATSVGLVAGFGTPMFAVALAFALIVMFDAQSVRAAAGHQAKILNAMMDELLHDHHLSQDKLKELLGHTRLEVFAGAAVGIGAAMLVDNYFG